jgi:hypothetical protein
VERPLGEGERVILEMTFWLFNCLA